MNKQASVFINNSKIILEINIFNKTLKLKLSV